MPIVLRPLLLLALGALSWPSSAQDDSAPAPAPAPPPAQSPAPPAAPPAGRAAVPRPSDDVFIPSEELAADEEVTFPVDI